MKKGLAVSAVIFGSVVYGLQPLFLKSGSVGPMSEICCTFIRFLTCAVLTGAMISIKQASFHISKAQALHLSIFGIFGYGFTNFLLFLAFKTVSVTVGIMCNYAYPALVLLVMMLFYKETCTPLKIAAVVSCITGLLLIILSDGEIEIAGLLLSLLSAVTYAVYIVSNEKSGFGKLDATVIVFYIFLFTALFFGLYALCRGELQLAATAEQLTSNLLAAVTSVISICCLTYGIKVLGASVAAFFCMSEPVTSVLMDALLLHTELGLVTIGGTALILSAVLFIAVSDYLEGTAAGPGKNSAS